MPSFGRCLAALAFAAAVAIGCSGDDSSAPPATDSTTGATATTEAPSVVQLEVEVLRAVPHRTDAFTQGLVWDDGVLYESAGRVGVSSLARVDPADGSVDEVVEVDPTVFAEGLALVDDRLVQLTWRDGVAFVWDAETFEQVDSFVYDGEGWGLCHDGERLVMSDGSAQLTFRDPETFATTGSVEVHLDGEPVTQLNELECVGEQVWANVWHTDSILGIEPGTGEVTTVVDASALRDRLDPPPTDDQAVLNGIAHDEAAGTFWLTGKLWPQLFEVRLERR